MASTPWVVYADCRGKGPWSGEPNNMGRKKKVLKDVQGIRIEWIDKDGITKDKQFISIEDNWRLMRAYAAIELHLKRHVWEIAEGFKYKGYMEGRRRKDK